MSRRLHLTDKGMGCRDGSGAYCALVAEPLQPEQENSYRNATSNTNPARIFPMVRWRRSDRL